MDFYHYHAIQDSIDVSAATWLLFDLDPRERPWEVRTQWLKTNFNEEMWDVYYTLTNICWDQIYSGAKYFTKGFIHIFMLVIEAINRKLPLHEKLYRAVNQRYQDRFAISILQDIRCHNKMPRNVVSHDVNEDEIRGRFIGKCSPELDFFIKVAEQTFEQFWAQHDENRPPKADVIIQWIKENFNLAKRNAETIDTMLRPEKYRLGGIKKKPTSSN